MASCGRQFRRTGCAAMTAGLLLCTAWYYTILSGFFVLYCPVMYLMFFSHRLYRKLTDALFAIWELYPVALFQCYCNTELHHFGDYVNANEKTIIVMNHRTRVDWNDVWIALYHATQNPDGETWMCKQPLSRPSDATSALDIGGKSKIKFVLKDEIKISPEWVSSCALRLLRQVIQTKEEFAKKVVENCRNRREQTKKLSK